MNEDLRQSTETAAALITRLVEAIVNVPRGIDLRSKELPRRVDWALRVDIEDNGKVVGKEGTHLTALRVILGMIGARLGDLYVLALDEPESRNWEPTGRPTPRNRYEPTDAAKLLEDLLAAMIGGPFVVTWRATPVLPSLRSKYGDAILLVTFTISPRSVEDYNLLVSPMSVPFEGDEMPPISALGSLFRAYGRKEGVQFNVRLDKPL